jgi:hypothetical protein
LRAFDLEATESEELEAMLRNRVQVKGLNTTMHRSLVRCVSMAVVIHHT